MCRETGHTPQRCSLRTSITGSIALLLCCEAIVIEDAAQVLQVYTALLTCSSRLPCLVLKLPRMPCLLLLIMRCTQSSHVYTSAERIRSYTCVSCSARQLLPLVRDRSTQLSQRNLFCRTTGKQSKRLPWTQLLHNSSCPAHLPMTPINQLPRYLVACHSARTMQGTFYRQLA